MRQRATWGLLGWVALVSAVGCAALIDVQTPDEATAGSGTTSTGTMSTGGATSTSSTSTGGTGGTTSTSSTSTGGTGGTTSTSSTTTSAGCASDGDCPATGTTCATPHCDTATQTCSNTVAPKGMTCSDHNGVVCNATGTCVAMHCTDSVQDADETDVDCGGPACPKCTLTQKCLGDTDCASGACDGIALTCVASQCVDNRQDGNETDVDCGGNDTCNRCPLGKKCLVDLDCVTGDGCLTGGNTCVNTCADGHVDGNETDVDCGGNDTCNRCNVTQNCVVDNDCASNACDALTNTCVPSQCADHRRDGNETDVDCGGGTCPACLAGDMCTQSSDCTSNSCLGGTCLCQTDSDCATNACDVITNTCVANLCADQHKDGNETDVDCGGGTCPTCPVGDSCTVSSDCASNNCFSGTCLCQSDADCPSNACDAITNLCVPDQCADHRVDGNETDVDCGGGTCPGCPSGKHCVVNSDCASNLCKTTTNHTCT